MINRTKGLLDEHKADSVGGGGKTREGRECLLNSAGFDYCVG